MRRKIWYDEESETFCKIFWELNMAKEHVQTANHSGFFQAYPT